MVMRRASNESSRQVARSNDQRIDCCGAEEGQQTGAFIGIGGPALVVQGLSEIPLMGDVPSWGALTVGTGLGNACFTNRKLDDKR